MLGDADAELLRRHVELFNVGVRSGDFGPMLEQFADDVAGYAWRRERGVRAAEMRITPAGDRIGRLVVAFA